MRGIAKNTGAHFHTFQSLLIRIPIRKTTNSPSIAAVTRLWITEPIAHGQLTSPGCRCRVALALQQLLQRCDPVAPERLHPFRLLGVGESLVLERHGALRVSL